MCHASRGLLLGGLLPPLDPWEAQGLKGTLIPAGNQTQREKSSCEQVLGGAVCPAHRGLWHRGLTVLLGVEPLTADPSWAEETGSKAELGDSPEEPRGGGEGGEGGGGKGRGGGAHRLVSIL